MDKTHEALSLALNALEQHYLEDAHSLQGKAITAIREALAQPEQIPPSVHSNTHQPDQEPVAWLSRRCVDNFPAPGYETCESTDYGAIPVYTTPPHRKPLTDEEITKIAEKYTEPLLFRVKDFARAIEAAHGIKGEA